MKSLWTVPTLQAQEEALAAQEVKRRRRQRGFTLIEMLAVVIILAIVAGVGFVVVNNQIEKSRNSTDLANLRTIADAANRYIMDGKSADDLKGNVTSTSKLVGSYLGSAPTDPWGSTNTYSIDVTDPSQSGPGQIIVKSPHTVATNNLGQSNQPNQITVNY